MALYQNLRDYHFGDGADDIRGANIYGADNQKLGQIEDVIFDQDSGDLRYVVVDAGGWLSTHKFIIPARHITTEEEGESDFHVNLSKQQVQKLPEYKEEQLESEESWSQYESSYKASWSEGPVLHREGSTRMITPPPEETLRRGQGGSGDQSGERNSPRAESEAHASPRAMGHDLPRFGATSDSNHGDATGSLVSEAASSPAQSNDDYDGIDALLPRETTEEPVTISRSEFLKEGTLRSAQDAPDFEAETRTDEVHADEVHAIKDGMDVNPVPGQTDGGLINASPDGGRRFMAFQARLRREREEILRCKRQQSKGEKTKEAA